MDGDAKDTNANVGDGNPLDLTTARIPIYFGEKSWATTEAFRRYPDDPLAAHWRSFGGDFHHDTVVVFTTQAKRKARAEELTRLFDPALRRLRKGDALDGLLRQRIADAATGGFDIGRPTNPPKGGG